MTALARNFWRFCFAPACAAQLATCRILWVGLLSFHLHSWNLSGHIAGWTQGAQSSFQAIPALEILALPLGGASRLSGASLQLVLDLTVVLGCMAALGLGTRICMPLFAYGSLLLGSWKFSFGESVVLNQT